MRTASDAFWLGAILLGMGIAAVVGILVARGLFIRMRQSEDPPPFTLQDLRKMRDSGEISDSEYQSMRQAIIGGVSAKFRESESRKLDFSARENPADGADDSRPAR